MSLAEFIPPPHLREERGCSLGGCFVAPCRGKRRHLGYAVLLLEVHSLGSLFLSTGFEGSQILTIFALQIREGCSFTQDHSCHYSVVGPLHHSLQSHGLSEMPQFGMSYCSLGVGPNCLKEISQCKHMRVRLGVLGIPPTSVPSPRPDTTTIHH